MMRAILSSLSPPIRGGVVVLTPEQRAAIRALYVPSVLMLGGAAVLGLLVLVGRLDSSLSVYSTYGMNVMFNSLCLGIVLCYATLPSRREELKWAIPGMVMGETWRFVTHPTWWSITMRMQTFGYIAGLVALTAIAWRTWRASGDERVWARAMLLLSLIMFFFPNVSYMLHSIVVMHTPTLYDAYAYTVDGAFGFQPAAETAKRVADWPPLWYATFLVYNELPLFMIIAVLLSLRWPNACYGHLMLHMTVIGLVGFVCYKLVPMKGIDLFVNSQLDSHWPLTPPLAGSPQPYADASGATRNCYPSLHMGWMLAVYLGSRRVNPWVNRFFGACCAVMLLATLNVGHYAVDLVASFPYVVAFFGVVNVRRPHNAAPRVAAIAVGSAIFLAFTAAILRDPLGLAANPRLLAASAIAIVGISLALEQWLARTTLVTPDQEAASNLLDEGPTVFSAPEEAVPV